MGHPAFRSGVRGVTSSILNGGDAQRCGRHIGGRYGLWRTRGWYACADRRGDPSGCLFGGIARIGGVSVFVGLGFRGGGGRDLAAGTLRRGYAQQMGTDRRSSRCADFQMQRF